MRYFYILPFKAQYYFPPQYKQHSFMLSLYTPYSLAGYLIWWFWRRVPFFKYFFTQKEDRIPNLTEIKQILSSDAIIAVNSGTKGPEQKTTCIVYLPSADQRFFLKYAVSEKAKTLIINEHLILQELKYLSGIPDIINYMESSNATLLQTTYIEGKKFQKTYISEEVYKLLLYISGVQGNFPSKVSNSSLEKHFAHGDFCPWNIIITPNGLRLIDWEMGGLYPIGYDLFTFIFQTQFILFPKKVTADILKENNEHINSFFKQLDIKNWKPYAIAFSQEKFHQNVGKSKYLSVRYAEIEQIIKA